MSTEYSEKSEDDNINYVCNFCDYLCHKKQHIKQHITTKSHKKMVFNNLATSIINNPTEISTNSNFTCDSCNKMYKERTGLWRHKKTCKTNTLNTEEIKEFENIKLHTEIHQDKQMDLILMLIKENASIIKENSDFKNMILEQQNMMMEVIKNGTHNTITNSHNKAFNLNFFLNETCKNAMNITEFVDSIQLQLSDFENVGDIGFVNGISNIIIKNLKALDVTKRPVHCTDQKRETIYIKDENKWEKEDEKNQKLRKVIKKVVSKNHRLILKFREVYPDYNKYSSPNSTRYDKIIIEAMGGLGNNDLEKEDKIIRNIVKNIGIDK